MSRDSESLLTPDDRLLLGEWRSPNTMVADCYVRISYEIVRLGRENSRLNKRFSDASKIGTLEFANQNLLNQLDAYKSEIARWRGARDRLNIKANSLEAENQRLRDALAATQVTRSEEALPMGKTLEKRFPPNPNPHDHGPKPKERIDELVRDGETWCPGIPQGAHVQRDSDVVSRLIRIVSDLGTKIAELEGRLDAMPPATPMAGLRQLFAGRIESIEKRIAALETTAHIHGGMSTPIGPNTCSNPFESVRPPRAL